MLPTPSNANQPKLEVVGAGSQGIGEMVQWMNDTEVMWAILRFDFGSGAFKRTKMVFLHFNGENTPVVRRGQANSKTDQVSALLRGKDGIFHASITRTEVSEVTIESIMNDVSRHVVIDSMDSPVALMKAYHEQLLREAKEAEEAQAAAVLKREKSPFGLEQPSEMSETATEQAKAEEASTPAPPPEEEKGPPPEQAEVVLPKFKLGTPMHGGTSMNPRKSIRVTIKPGFAHIKDVGQANGTLDWVVILPDPNLLPLVGAGSEGVNEMRELVETNEDKVMYALLRVTLGQDSMKRAKWIFLHIIGHSTKVVRRGRWNAVRPNMQRKFKEFANIGASLSDLDSEDITEELIMQEIKKVSIADDDVAAADKGDKVDISTFKKKMDKQKEQGGGELLTVAEGDEEEEEEEEEVQPEREVTMNTMTTSKSKAEIDEEEDEMEVEEEVPEEPPNADKSMFEVLSMVRESNQANWGLFCPKGKK